MADETVDISEDPVFDAPEFDWSSLPTDQTITDIALVDEYQNWTDFYANPENQKVYTDVLKDAGSDPSVKDLRWTLYMKAVFASALAARISSIV